MYWLTEELAFPHPKYASPEGLLAVGGDLSPKRLLLAYENGIFPWYNEGEPILWWSPNPRFVLFPSEIKVSKSMRQVFRKEKFHVSFDTAFDEVIEACGSIPRTGQNGTWLTEEMKEAYIHLHHLGFAHSVETWEGDKLVGGLYGLALGNCFFGESMFAKTSNASKTALICLAKTIEKKGFDLIDCQSETKHLATMGAKFINRVTFLTYLEKNRQNSTISGSWSDWEPQIPI
ncbi:MULTISPECIES: leucyl/phenylalanyl-tRNA--protein transferase [unclassified Aureispira]|uniref:leucyl/phenylalanyl-tRNA--protein transferase n=1 Tax=unclassified Aureispira TaxID=2649989 RepID=UPI0006983758|nr:MULTISPECIES: leucyl/phenylalanyl-tRNA--protein transferase [unclassified Aureispira]WMX17300.1 leucyl/phenylalanyl-tRNA--protein transferase [Aureispira sp. CCB-E]